MAGVIYLLCAAAALACAVLLWRGYRRGRVRLLLWSGLCFAALALENIFLFIDDVVVPHIDLSYLWLLTSLAGTALLVFGLIWEDR